MAAVDVTISHVHVVCQQVTFLSIKQFADLATQPTK
jgi:hypothetical protein